MTSRLVDLKPCKQETDSCVLHPHKQESTVCFMLSSTSYAHLTLERFFTGVSLDMPLEGALVDERLATGTERTLVHLGKAPHVRLLVPPKAPHVREALVAHFTPESSNHSSAERLNKGDKLANIKLVNPTIKHCHQARPGKVNNEVTVYLKAFH